MLGAVVGGNFSLIGEYSSTVKNQQKRTSVYHSVGVLGLRTQKHMYGLLFSINFLRVPKLPGARGHLISLAQSAFHGRNKCTIAKSALIYTTANMIFLVSQINCNLSPFNWCRSHSHYLAQLK
jgi:hypothetical protein